MKPLPKGLNRDAIRSTLLRVARTTGILPPATEQSDEDAFEALLSLAQFAYDGTDLAQREPPVLVAEHPRFASQPLDNAGIIRVGVVKSGCTLLLKTIEEACPHNRHRSLAITALEEACMWAVKAISHEKVPL